MAQSPTEESLIKVLLLVNIDVAAASKDVPQFPVRHSSWALRPITNCRYFSDMDPSSSFSKKSTRSVCPCRSFRRCTFVSSTLGSRMVSNTSKRSMSSPCSSFSSLVMFRSTTPARSGKMPPVFRTGSAGWQRWLPPHRPYPLP